MSSARSTAMSSESEALKERTMSFAVSILQFIEAVPGTIGARIGAGPLANAATSVGANYRAVCAARSDREFVAKFRIANEEADESVARNRTAVQVFHSSHSWYASVRGHATPRHFWPFTQ